MSQKWVKENLLVAGHVVGAQFSDQPLEDHGRLKYSASGMEQIASMENLPLIDDFPSESKPLFKRDFPWLIITTSHLIYS